MTFVLTWGTVTVIVIIVTVITGTVIAGTAIIVTVIIVTGKWIGILCTDFRMMVMWGLLRS